MVNKVLLLSLILLAFSCDSSTDTYPETQSIRSCQADPAIISRQEWNARVPAADMEPLIPIQFIIHHSGVLQTPDVWIGDRMANIQNYHMDILGFPDILYHYYIDVFGNIAEGREIQFEINRELYNSSQTIHITLEGNFEIELMTPEQLESLDQLLCLLSDTFAIDPVEIYGHKDFYSATACPGNALYLEIENIMARVEDLFWP